MENKITSIGFSAKGTTCRSCEEIIKRQASKIEGVISINFDYATEKGKITFNRNITNIDNIFKAIEEKGYSCSLNEEIEPDLSKMELKKLDVSSIGWVAGILGFITFIYFITDIIGAINIPAISQNMSYGLLFIVGLLTGFHCIAMCGGFVVSYTAKDAQNGVKSHTSHFMYGLGKTISYTLIGAIFGLVGSIIAFTPLMRGIAGILAGMFLIGYGLKMLNIFPSLRRLNISSPRFISKFVGEKSAKHSNPFIIGLLNGLMIACGPLQAIYIMAAGTGSPIEGAKLLFVFALGTLPVMIGFGYITSFISHKATSKILKLSGTIVIILGLVMLNNGLTLTGRGYDFSSAIDLITPQINGNAVSNSPNPLSSIAKISADGVQEINMVVDGRGFTPNQYILKKGIKTRWIIDGKSLNGCNNAIQVPAYNLNFNVKQGKQIIEFTPDQTGTVRWSCWMGMIKGTFIVKDDISDTTAMQKELNSAPISTNSGSCGMSKGSCGCGMMS